MSYAPYPAYKDSGVPWLGNIPEHWDWAKLYLLSKRYAGGTPDKNISEYWENGTIPWLNSGSVNQFNIDTPSAFITEEAYKNSSAKWVPEGALLMALAGQGKTKGMVAQTTFDTTCNQSMAAIVWKKANSRFMLWWLNSQYLNIRGLASSDARDGLNLEMLARIPCPLPSKEEQTAIADFLDKKTAEIDDLIAKKEELLCLLAEQRTALITHAVTKGLNPNAPMNPSGIDWLGDVPEGWDLLQLRYVATPIIGLTYSPNDVVGPGEGTLVLRSTNIQNGQLSLHDNVYVSAEVPEKLKIKAGDILVCSRNGSRKLIGKNALITEDHDGWSFGAFTTVIRSDHGAFLYWVLNSGLFEFQSGRFLTSTINQLTIGVLNSFEVPFPPSGEQKDICDFLSVETRKIDETAEKTVAAIERLREYRTALITNAVTGKIKVS